MMQLKPTLANLPLPLAGVALAIASLGWCWDSLAISGGYGQLLGSIIAAPLVGLLLAKIICYPKQFGQDLRHPVTGSVAPTLAMAVMVISNQVSKWSPMIATGLWLAAVLAHLGLLASFIYHRRQSFALADMVPSWFIPPVGLVVADVSFTTGRLALLAQGLLYLGLLSYALLLPIMLYRLRRVMAISEPFQPTIAVMAAPPSLTLAGYLAVHPSPSVPVVVTLLTIAVIMTAAVYWQLRRLLSLPFYPSFAALTFPLVISATAMFRSHAWFASLGYELAVLHWLALIELAVATLVVSYVAWRYLCFARSPAQQLA